jgi:hypothetical protein
MLQRQIVVNSLGRQIGTDDLACMKYAGTSFQSIAWMLIYVNVTIYRTIALPESYENSHYIMLTTKLLRRCI